MFCPKWRLEKGPFLTVACCPRHRVLWLSKAITLLPVSCLAHACGCRMGDCDFANLNWRALRQPTAGLDRGRLALLRFDGDHHHTMRCDRGRKRAGEFAEIFVPPEIANRCIEMIRISQRFGSRSAEHTSELQSQFHLVCRLLL